MNETIAPWHLASGQVYHIRRECGAPMENQVPGTAGRRVCLDCLQIILQELVERA